MKKGASKIGVTKLTERKPRGKGGGGARKERRPKQDLGIKGDTRIGTRVGGRSHTWPKQDKTMQKHGIWRMPREDSGRSKAE
jgi:hypothetical protein